MRSSSRCLRLTVGSVRTRSLAGSLPTHTRESLVVTRLPLSGPPETSTVHSALGPARPAHRDAPGWVRSLRFSCHARWARSAVACCAAGSSARDAGAPLYSTSLREAPAPLCPPVRRCTSTWAGEGERRSLARACGRAGRPSIRVTTSPVESRAPGAAAITYTPVGAFIKRSAPRGFKVGFAKRTRLRRVSSCSTGSSAASSSSKPLRPASAQDKALQGTRATAAARLGRGLSRGVQLVLERLERLPGERLHQGRQLRGWVRALVVLRARRRGRSRPDR